MVSYRPGYIRLLALFLFTLAVIMAFVSCRSAGTADQLPPYKNDLGIKPAELARLDTARYSTIEWDSARKNFGIVQEGDSITLQFKFKNTGIHPLFLVAVKPSCGCTVPQYPKDAIMPGEEGILTVGFNSSGQEGAVYKTIPVTSNTSNGAIHVLLLEGKVVAKKR